MLITILFFVFFCLSLCFTLWTVAGYMPESNVRINNDATACFTVSVFWTITLILWIYKGSSHVC